MSAVSVSAMASRCSRDFLSLWSAGAAGDHRVVHLRGALHVHATHAGGRGEGAGPGDERHLRPAARGGLRDGEAHLAGGAVGDVADGVDSLVRGPGVHENTQPGEVARGEKRERRGHDLVHRRELALAHVPAGEPPAVGAGKAHAALAQRGNVGLRGGALPHVDVHAGGHQHRAAPPAGQKRRREAVVGDAAGHLGHHVGRGRDHHGGVRPLGKVDVRDGGGRVAVERRGDRGPGERLEGRGAHELLGVGGHGHADLAARLLKPAQHLAGLVRGDPPAHGEKDARPAPGSRPEVLLAHSWPSSEVMRMRWQYGHSVISSPWARSWKRLGCSFTRQTLGTLPTRRSTARPLKRLRAFS